MNLRGSARRALRGAAVQLIGRLVAREYWNKIRGWKPTRDTRRREAAEIERIKASCVLPPYADVAVIMPTFRRAELLLEALGSVLRQTMPNFVVLVVDDGGGLPDLPKDPRVFAVSLSRNLGVLGAVRNIGIQLTQSRVLAFLDDDNQWDPRHLEVALPALAGGAQLTYAALRRITQDGTEVDVLAREFDRRLLANESYIDINSVVVVRNPSVQFSRLPRSRATRPPEDWEFIWRLTRTMKVQHVPDVTVTYLINKDSYYTEWADSDG